MTEPLITLPPGLEPFDLEPVELASSQIVKDFFASTSPLRQAEIDWLIARGVPPLALERFPIVGNRRGIPESARA